MHRSWTGEQWVDALAIIVSPLVFNMVMDRLSRLRAEQQAPYDREFKEIVASYES